MRFESGSDREIEQLLADIPAPDQPAYEAAKEVQAARAAPAENRAAFFNSADYTFPVTPSPASEPQQVLDGQLEALCETRDTVTKKLVSYAAIREEFCRINVQMNLVGLRPPSERPARRALPKRANEPVTWQNGTLSVDRKCIDLHWLSVAGYDRPLCDGEFKDLLRAEEFDFAAASAFSTRPWTTEKRVNKIIALTDLEQWQMAVLISNAERSGRNHLMDESIRIERLLRERQQRGVRCQWDPNALSQLWRAWQRCQGKNLVVIAQVYGWQRGEPPLSTPRMSNKLRHLQSVLSKL
jgi:hypothetical protein